MAKSAATTAAPKPFGRETEELKDRMADARRQKDEVAADLTEALFFCNPRLARNLRSSQGNSDTEVGRSAEELATDTETELSTDFATELVSGFFPEMGNWVRSAPGEDIEEADWGDIEGAVEERDARIFQAIRASGFDATLALALVPEAAVGTVALMINDAEPSQPISCLHVPIRELEIDLGRDGKVDFRAATKWVRARQVKSYLPNVMLPAKVAEKIEKEPNQKHSITWAWWRDWDEPADLVWYYCVSLDDEVVAVDHLRGEGSCALIVFRFMPHATNAWGNGPAIQSLPNLRVIDALTMLTQDRADVAISPPIGYPDDGVFNFEQGIQAGHAYPMRPGSGQDIVPLYFQGDPNIGLYEIDDLKRSVRRAHYADYPEQTGDTPPTATQWVDEMVMTQRRIGTPGKAFWREGPAEIFKRYSYLLTKRGKLEPVELDGKEIALVPENPATKAQEQMEVQLGVRVLEICNTFMPETSKAAIDELQTIKNIKEKVGDKLIALRPKEMVEELVTQMLTQAAAGEMAGGDAEAPA